MVGTRTRRPLASSTSNRRSDAAVAGSTSTIEDRTDAATPWSRSAPRRRLLQLVAPELERPGIDPGLRRELSRPQPAASPPINTLLPLVAARSLPGHLGEQMYPP